MTAPEIIARINGYQNDAYTYYPVIIVGGGEAGIAMGCQLKSKLGFDQFRIFERHSGIGGTWHINRYPGIACDVPVLFYSFSFAQSTQWTDVHPSGLAIVKYLQDVCAKFQITDKIQLNTEVTKVEWLDEEHLWELTLAHLVSGMGDLSTRDRLDRISKNGLHSVYHMTEKARCKVLVSGMGGLVEPQSWPEDIPGRESFEGHIFHSARWDDTVDLKNKDVIVVGTGCSAAQLVPELVKPKYNAKSVTQLMRTPPWVVPGVVPPGGHESWAKWAPYIFGKVPFVQNFLRFCLYCFSELDFYFYFGDTAFHKEKRKNLENQLIYYLKRSIPEKYHEIMIPDYAVCCKRRIFDVSWLASLNEPNIDITTKPLTKLHPRHVTLGPGRTYPSQALTHSKVPTDEVKIPADVIILANGFDLTRFLHPLKVTGRGGRDLQEVWDERGGAQAYQGTAIDGFPNFFLLFGPNTATGHSSIVHALENMVMYSLHFIGPILRGEIAECEIKEEAERAYTEDIQRALKKTVFRTGGCLSWYQTESWNYSVYPYQQIEFMRRCYFPRWNDWNITYTRKGLVLRRIRQVAKILVVTAAFYATIHVYQAGKGLRDIPNIIRGAIRNVLGFASGLFMNIKDHI